MMQIKVSTKHLQIDRSQSIIAGTIAVATIVTAFSLVSSKALLSQAAFQRRVLSAKNKAIVQIDTNIKTANTIVDQYNNVFQGDSPTNVIGGTNTKDKDAKPPDGDNARIVLDALPTTYDFPALLTSVSYMLNTDSISNPSIAGTDDSSTAENKPTANPEPTVIALTVQGTATYANIQKFTQDLERSIRPFDVLKFSIGGNENSMTLQASVNTYYQPAKALTITNKEIK